MEIKKLKEFASIVQSLKSKKKTALDIFYNVENCSDLLCNDHNQMYTPTYVLKTAPVISFRGFIKKDGHKRLIVGLEHSSSSQSNIAKCTTSVFNKDTEEYMDLNKSEINLSSTKSFEFPIELSDLHYHINENDLLFKWNIEILPSSHEKVKSPNIVSEDSNQKDNITRALDGLFKTLSSDKQSDSDKQKTLLSMLQNVAHCKDQQTKLENKLHSIEQKVHDIDSRLLDMLTNMSDTEKSFVEATGLQLTQSSTNPVISQEKKLESEKKTTLKEDSCTITSPSLHEKTKYIKTKEWYGKKSPIRKPILSFINPTTEARETKELYDKLIDIKRPSPAIINPVLIERETKGWYDKIKTSLRPIPTFINPKIKERSRVRHVLLIGSDIHLIRSILLHEYNILPPWLISETDKLVLMKCEDKGIYFYIGLVPEFLQKKHILSLMIYARSSGYDYFDGCLLVINSPSDTNLVHMFDIKFLEKFCFLLVSEKFNYLSLLYNVKGVVRTDWLYPSLDGKFKLLEGVTFVFDELILSQTCQEKNELQEKVRSFMSFLTTIESTSEVDERMQSLTEQMVPLLKQCHTLLEVKHTEQKKN